MEFRRAASLADWKSIRSICVQAAFGQRIAEDSLRARLHADYWIEPYRRFWPEWAWVAEESGEVLGYLVACPDALAHVRKRFCRYDGIMVLGLLAGKYGWNRSSWRMLLRLLGVLPLPEKKFGNEMREVYRHFPAHLHMNFRAEAQGRGGGKAIVQCCLEQLRAAGITGIHLLCAEGPLPFYLKQGFSVRSYRDLAMRVYLLVRSLEAQA